MPLNIRLPLVTTRMFASKNKIHVLFDSRRIQFMSIDPFQISNSGLNTDFKDTRITSRAKADKFYVHNDEIFFVLEPGNTPSLFWFRNQQSTNIPCIDFTVHNNFVYTLFKGTLRKWHVTIPFSSSSYIREYDLKNGHELLRSQFLTEIATISENEMVFMSDNSVFFSNNINTPHIQKKIDIAQYNSNNSNSVLRKLKTFGRTFCCCIEPVERDHLVLLSYNVDTNELITTIQWDWHENWDYYPFENYYYITKKDGIYKHEINSVQNDAFTLPPNRQVTATFVNEDFQLIADNTKSVFILQEHLQEEDKQFFREHVIDKDDVLPGYDVNNCSNTQLVLYDEPYSQSDNPVMIYFFNEYTKFDKATCFTLDELRSHLSIDKDKYLTLDTPSNLMSIYSKPRDSRHNTDGISSFPTTQIVVKLPNQQFVTFGSLKRVVREFNENKIWFALPLFGGKKRRVGNLLGIFTVPSTNHGQTPGFPIYKLFTADDILNENNNIHHVFPSQDDFPGFYIPSNKSLLDVLNELHQPENEPQTLFLNNFFNNLIDELLHTR